MANRDRTITTATAHPSTAPTPNHPGDRTATPSTHTRTRRPTPPPLSTHPLNPLILKLVLDRFDRALPQPRYAVTGHAALMVWGYRRRQHGSLAGYDDRAEDEGDGVGSEMTAHVSVLCPAEDCGVILSWAKVVGWGVYREVEGKEEEEGEGGRVKEVIGVPVYVPVSAVSAATRMATKTAASTSSGCAPLLLGPHSGLEEEVEVVVGVRLRAVSSRAWEKLWIVRPSEMEAPFIGWVGEMVRTEARVVAIPTLLNEFARAWYLCLTQSGGMGSPQERHIASLILWIMRRLAADVRRHGYRARWMLTVEEVPNLAYPEFWRPFVAEYGEKLRLIELGSVVGES